MLMSVHSLQVRVGISAEMCLVVSGVCVPRELSCWWTAAHVLELREEVCSVIELGFELDFSLSWCRQGVKH